MIWNTLIKLRAALKIKPARQIISISTGEAGAIDIGIDEPDPAADLSILLTDAPVRSSVTVRSTGPFSLQLVHNEALDAAALAELLNYLPYVLLPCYTQQRPRAYAISHFAQTLDGRIAASNGESRWIGNAENLTHAHRMRALCDAILVGVNTMRTDNPRLSVRHVNGTNPVRVIVGNSGYDDKTRSESPLLHIRTKGTAINEHEIQAGDQNGQLDCPALLQALFARDIKSVYIEGGATTTSSFLHAGVLDQVQIHIAPSILGSGLTGFNFSGVDSMMQAHTFRSSRFVPMGDQVMFVGEP